MLVTRGLGRSSQHITTFGLGRSIAVAVTRAKGGLGRTYIAPREDFGALLERIRRDDEEIIMIITTLITNRIIS